MNAFGARNSAVIREGVLDRGATVKESLTVQPDGELSPAATHKEYLSVRQRAAQRHGDFHKLGAIISVAPGDCESANGARPSQPGAPPQEPDTRKGEG